MENQSRDKQGNGVQKESRDTLRNLFKKGAMPTEEAFASLINSMINILDQGIDKNPDQGLLLGQVNQGRLLSFYRDMTPPSTIWSISMTQPDNCLEFGARGGSDYYPAMRLGPATVKPAPAFGPERKPSGYFELDLQGSLQADGRLGRALPANAKGRDGTEVIADGKWHDVTPGLNGCHAFEVMAGVGRQNSGKYALLHAFALNTFHHGEGEISYQRTHFGSRCCRLELRWDKPPGPLSLPYFLQIRVGCSYAEPDAGPPPRIQVYLTQLWFDPAMSGSNPEQKEQTA